MSLHTTRRGFLAGAAGLMGAAAGAPAARGAIDNESAGFKLGVASYSLREFQRGLAIRLIRELKTPYVSVKDVHLEVTGTPADWQRGRREFEKGGLKIVSGGAIYFTTTDLEDTRRKFEYARACGMPLIVAGPPRTGLAVMEKFAKEYDIRIAVHNHGPEDKNFPTPRSVLELVRDMDPHMGLCMDLGHSARAGADVVASIADAGSRLMDIHIKDLLELGTPAARQCDVGDGAMPVAAIFRQLKKIGYTGCVNLEYEINGDNPMPGIERSFSYMRGVLAGMAG